MTSSLSKFKTLFRALFLSTLIIITTLAFLPNYDNLPDVVSFSDILNHALAFFVLYILFEYSDFTQKSTFKFSLFLVYAIFIEVVQYFLPTRCADFYDVVADLSGVMLAYFLIKIKNTAI